MGLNYVKIHACHNDCILYKKEYEKLDECLRCGESCYKLKDNVDDNDYDGVSKKGPPSKVKWYQPIISRFKRLFSNVNDLKDIIWHADERKYDGKFIM